MATFFETITEAIRHFEVNGFTSVEDLQIWIDRLRKAAAATLVPEAKLDDELRRVLSGVYKRMIDDGQIIKKHPGIARFTVDRLKPKLRTELDRRMMVSRSLIKLNREQMMDQVERRFSGWASSIPAGGSRAIDIKDVKENIRKPLTSMPFTERRVMIDQGAKFVSSLNEIIATDGGAIAAQWHSQWRRPGYHFRPDHKERDMKVYVIRGNWALQKGLMKAGPAGYYDDITKPAEEVYCSCSAVYLYSLRELPDDMLTIKGRESLAEARAKIQAMRK
ncbi:hypothetical protein [Burkholderia sp. BCC0405]|uniref:hypothetical protein n=1 Tax=Burkholderia sp. BCC0405 TaxID=2676298 RepID=UPI00158CFCB0|nr:hypothetical protein [Burkholderia sp. BCC0405]